MWELILRHLNIRDFNLRDFGSSAEEWAEKIIEISYPSGQSEKHTRILSNRICLVNVYYFPDMQNLFTTVVPDCELEPI